jgi:hypothetical protein
MEHVTPEEARSQCEQSLAAANARVGELTLALTALDHGAAVAAATALSAALESTQRYVGACAANERDRVGGELVATAERAAPLVAIAPAPSRAAITAGLAGDWTLWDREVDAWRARLASLPGTSPRPVAHTVGVTPNDIDLGRVEIGAISTPIDVVFYNKGADPVTIDSVAITAAPAQPPPLPGEFDLTGAPPATLAPHAIARLDLAYRPMVPRDLAAEVTLEGHTATSRVQRSARVRATGVQATRANAEANELSLARRDSADASALAARPRSYAEMLTAVLAAQRLTTRPDRSGEAEAAAVLEPVAARLDELMENCDATLRSFGAGIVAGRSEIGHAQFAIHQWLRKLRSGSSITTQPLVDEFRYGAETIRLLTRERDDAPSLRAFDRANTYTLVGIVAPIAAIAGVAGAAAAASMVGVELAEISARGIVQWALARPMVAQAALHTLIGLGMQLGDDASEWPHILAQLKDPHFAFQFFSQVVMDGAGVMEASRMAGSPSEEAAPPAVRVREAKEVVDGVASEAGAEQGKPSAAPVNATIAPVAADSPTSEVTNVVLRGDAVAAKVPGTTYHDGTFRITTPQGTADVIVERTGDTPRLRAANGGYVIEAPGSLDREALARVVAEKLSEARAELEATPAATAAVMPTAATRGAANARVTTAVPGLFESIDPKAPAPKGWQFKDEWRGPHELKTTAWDENGLEGSVLRSYDAKNRTWTMKEAFFAAKMNRWIPSDVPMVEGKGTPLITYLDLRQMKALGATYGSIVTTKLSTVQNVEAICQLETNVKAGMSLDDAAAKTHSVAYAETELVQSGHHITNVRVAGADTILFNDLLEFYEGAHGGRQIRTPAEHDAILAKYDMHRTDTVHFNYDVYLDVEPVPATGTGVGAGAGAP